MSKIMTKKELTTLIATKANVSLTEANLMVQSLSEIIPQTLAEGIQVRLNGIGTFKPTDVPERTGRNPATGEPITVAAHRRVKFSSAKSLKETINGA